MFSLGVGVFFGFILLLLLKKWRNIDNIAMTWCRRVNLVLCFVVVIMLPWWMILLNILLLVVLAIIVLKTRLARWVLPWA